jgi:hypothetical protein
MAAGRLKPKDVSTYLDNLILKCLLHNSTAVIRLCGRMVEKYNTILVIGGEGEKCRQVAESYGFRDIVTPGDIIKDNEHIMPFQKLTTEEREKSRKRDYGNTKIDAIFVFADSRDWPVTARSSLTSLYLREGILELYPRPLTKVHRYIFHITMLSGRHHMKMCVSGWVPCERLSKHYTESSRMGRSSIPSPLESLR